MNEIIVIFSSKKEAQYFLFHSGIKFKKREDFYFSSKENEIKVFFCGIGKDPVLNFVKNHHFLKTAVLILIKAGTAALIDKNLTLLTPYIPLKISYNKKNYILNFESVPSTVKDKTVKYLSEKALITVETGLNNINNSIFFNNYSFADMETFFIYENYHNLPFLPLIVPTDYCNIQEFHNNLDKASIILKDALIEILKNLI